MAAANGEYVKVYLYILRHQGENITLEVVADALNHTESDVRRALSYWEKAGVLALSGKREADTEHDGENLVKKEEAASRETISVEEPIAEDAQRYSQEQVNRLSGDEEFAQLLYIAQKYMNKVFTPRDCQVFAYLYDGLRMKTELLEYLVEYCAQNGHTSVRYLETVALSWHERGVKTAQDAKDFCAAYTKDSFAVMKAFGLNSRKPAAAEQKFMDKWFKEYGFTKEIVLEACNRTISAIHNPSFQYADKILTDWKKAGVKSAEDIRKLDTRRTAYSEDKPSSGIAGVIRQRTGKTQNQFHNFSQRDTDYDALVLKQVKERLGQE
jgi:DnaD/phage-associated family protein